MALVSSIEARYLRYHSVGRRERLLDTAGEQCTGQDGERG
jgi:hypothetical protein